MSTNDEGKLDANKMQIKCKLNANKTQTKRKLNANKMQTMNRPVSAQSLRI